jgi:Tfp pilus assembly protein PilN
MTTFPDVTAPGRPETEVTSARVDWATVPKVNLLPPEILQGRRLARLKRALGAGVGVTLVLCAAATVWAVSGASSAQEDYDAAQSRGAILRTEQAKYAAVPKVLGLIQAAGTARERAMSTDVLWYGFLSDLAVTTPKGVTLNGLQVSLDAPSTSADPLLPSGIGTVTFTGAAQHFPDVAAWLDAVGTVHGLDGSSLQSATRAGAEAAQAGDAEVNFTSTIAVTSKALTHRYDRKAN